jgi:Tol biopolymer transport system component
MVHFSYASPDRKSELLVEMNVQGLFDVCRIVAFDGRSPSRPIGPNGPCIGAAWSRDGRWMYFSATVDGASHLWRQRFPDGDPQRVTSGPAQETGVAVAPDGSLVTSIGMERSSIRIRDDAGERQVSTEGGGVRPRLSRDETRVFYLHQGDQLPASSDLRALDLASGKSTRLLPDWFVRDFDISDDESEVVFTAETNAGETELRLAWLDRRAPPRSIARGGTSVSFGANGALIYRHTEADANFLYRINRDGSSRARISTAPILEKLGTSPDGQWVTATVSAGTGPRGRAQLQTVAIPVKGGPSRTICTPRGWLEVHE